MKTNDTRPMRARIESEIEPTGEYETVVQVLIDEAAKPVTTRLAAKIEAALRQHDISTATWATASTDDSFDVRITRFAGMTSIEWGGYTRSSGNRGHSILLSHGTKSEPIAQRYLDDMKRYVAAKHERNERRRALLATDVPERMDAALALIATAFRELTAIHDADDNYSVLPSASTLMQECIA